MSGPVVRRPLPCVQCGYDLEGLAALGQCPECGRSIVDSLAARLDLDPRAGPEVPFPRRVAATLLLAAAGCLGGSLVFGALLARLALEATAGPAAPFLGHALSAAAVALTSAGFLGFLLVLPWLRHDRFVRAKVLGTGGFALWIAAALADPAPMTATYTALPASMVLVALAPLLSELGPRSPAFRRARATRQQVHVLLVSTGLAGGAGATAAFLELHGGLDELVWTLRIVAVASAMLTAVGFGYLVLNAAWILGATLRPPLSLDEAIGSGTPDRDGERNPVPTGHRDAASGEGPAPGS